MDRTNRPKTLLFLVPRGTTTHQARQLMTVFASTKSAEENHMS